MPPLALVGFPLNPSPFINSKNVSIGNIGRIQALCSSPSSALHISFDQGYLQFKLCLVPFSRTMHEVCLEGSNTKTVSNVDFTQFTNIPC